MKRITTLVLLISFLACKNKSYEEPNKTPQIKSSVSIEYFDRDEGAKDVLYGNGKRSLNEQKIDLLLKYIKDDTITSNDLNELDNIQREGKKIKKHLERESVSLGEVITPPKGYYNKPKLNKRYSTEGIEYSEKWRVRAFKATKDFVLKQFPIDNRGCNITATGYYRPYNVKYIGGNSFSVKLYIIFKCGNDSYKHKKYLWLETHYFNDDNTFGFSLIKDRYVD